MNNKLQEEEIKTLIGIYQKSNVDYIRDDVYDRINKEFEYLIKGFARSKKAFSISQLEDLNQELALSLVEALNGYDLSRENKFITYLYFFLKAGKRRWLTNSDLIRYKDKAPHLDYIFTDVLEESTKDNYSEKIENVNYKHLWFEFQDFIAGFPAQDKDIINLKMAGYHNSQIAKELGVIESTIKSRIQIIRDKLKDHFGSLDENQ